MAEKTNMWCERCQENTPCPVTESRGLWKWSEVDVHYRSRLRECVVCKSSFPTIEINKETFRNYQMAVSAYEAILKDWQEIEKQTIEKAKVSLEWLNERRDFLSSLLNRPIDEELVFNSKPILKLVDNEGEKLSD